MYKATYGTRSKEILSKDNPLRLNDEEVDELGDITHEGVQGLLADSVVFSWANLRGESSREESLASSFSCNSDS